MLKIVFRIVDVDFDDFFKYSPATVTRGHRYKLFVQRSSGIRKTFLVNALLVFGTLCRLVLLNFLRYVVLNVA